MSFFPLRVKCLAYFVRVFVSLFSAQENSVFTPWTQLFTYLDGRVNWNANVKSWWPESISSSGKSVTKQQPQQKKQQQLEQQQQLLRKWHVHKKIEISLKEICLEMHVLVVADAAGAAAVWKICYSFWATSLSAKRNNTWLPFPVEPVLATRCIFKTVQFYANIYSIFKATQEKANK